MERDPRHVLGERGESAVCASLSERGFVIVERNARVGRAEIDIVAKRGRLLVFCEVRTRRRADFVSPLETIDARKVARLRRAARGWLVRHRSTGHAVRFDVAAVTFETGKPAIDYVEDAF